MLGTPHSAGYLRATFRRKEQLVHRVIWLHQNGEWPKNFIDHINGRKTDNRIENLRDVSNQQNSRAFKTPYKGVSSRFRGVTWDKQHKKWRSQLLCNGKQNYLGLFIDEIKAASAYDEAAQARGFADEALNFEPRGWRCRIDLDDKDPCR